MADRTGAVPPARDTRLSAIVYGGLALGLSVTLYLREGSPEQSRAHLGELGFGGLRYGAEASDRTLGTLCAIAAVGLLVLGALRGLAFVRARATQHAVTAALTLLLVVSAAAWGYGARGVARPDYVKMWDAFHYVMGPKYFEELGYFGLYDCVALADAESAERIGDRDRIRDLRGYGMIRAGRARSRTDCRERFTPERWESFRHDYSFFEQHMGRTIREAVRDHGYNGTPAHAWLSGTLANAFELDYRSLLFASLGDPLAILLMMFFVSRAFGFRLGALFAIFFFTSFTDRGYFILGSFFRYHWLYLTGFGLAALQRRKLGRAGGFIAAAAMLNVFPLLFFAGIGLKVLWSLTLERRLSPEHRRFILGAAVVALVLFASSLSVPRGLGNYGAFLENMEQHSGLVTRSRIGLRYVFSYRGEVSDRDYYVAGTAAAVKQTRPFFFAGAALLLACLVALVRRLDDLEATILAGFSIFFCLFSTVEYYYGIYAFIVLLWRARLGARLTPLWLALPFLGTCAAYLVYDSTSVLGLANNMAMSFAIALTLICTQAALLAGRETSRPLEWLRRGALATTLATGVAIAVLAVLLLPPRSVARAQGPVLAFGGDVNLGRRQHLFARRHGHAAALEEVTQLAEADLALVNLECVVASVGESRVEKNESASYYFRGRPEMLATLREAGVDVVSTANNHSLDYGPAALAEQASLLDAMGIGHAGSGQSREQACQPVYRWAGDVSVAIFGIDTTQPSFSAAGSRPGTCHFDLADHAAARAELEPRIAAARERAHVVLVAPHWGANRRALPTRAERRFGRALVDAGADAVLGTSAHMVQGVERYRGRAIVHDAGDLLMDYKPGPENGALFSLVLSQDGVRQLWVTPLHRGNSRTRPAEGRRATRLVDELWRRSAELGTRLVRVDGGLALDLSPPGGRPPPARPPAANPAPGPAPAPLSSPPPQCVVSAVPGPAALTPTELGPVTLLGAAVHTRELEGRRTVWVESYWTGSGAIGDSLQIGIRGRPRGGLPGGFSGDHEPCDWQWPTDRWQPGVIYRDEYGVRPSDGLKDGVYDFAIEVRRGRRTLGEPAHVGTVTVGSR